MTAFKKLAIVFWRGEILTPHIYMKLFSSIAAAAVIGTSFIAASPVKAGGCYPPIAAQIIDQVIKGGGSPKQAMDAAVSDGNINNQE